MNNSKRMTVEQALDALKKINQTVSAKGIMIDTIAGAFKDVVSLEHRFAANQPVNVIHWPAGFGSAEFLKTNGIYTYRQLKAGIASVMKNYGGLKGTLKLYKQLKAKHHNLLTYSTDLGQHGQDKASSTVDHVRQAVRDYVCVKFYAKQGFDADNSLYYENLVGLLRKPTSGYIYNKSKYDELMMPMSVNTIKCLVDLDASNLKHTVAKDIRDAISAARQPKQMQLI